MKMKKKEKKKIMKIVQKFISNINGKENRERASVVLTKIVNESKVLLFLYIIRIFMLTEKFWPSICGTIVFVCLIQRDVFPAAAALHGRVI